MRRLSYGIAAVAAAAVTAAAASIPFAACAAPNGTTGAKQKPEARQGSTPVPDVNATPRIVFGGLPLPIPLPARAPYRDPADGNLCVAPESLAPLGVTFLIDDAAGKVTLTGSDGVLITTVDLRLAPATVLGRAGVFVPAVQVIEALGGKCEWKSSEQTLYARAVLIGAEIIGGQIRLRATLPILPRLRSDNGGRQALIEVPGAEIGTLSRDLTLNAPEIVHARAGQFNDDTARFVLDLKRPGSYVVLGGKADLQVLLNPTDKLPEDPTAKSTAVVAKTVTALAARAGTLKKPAMPPPPASVVNGVTFRSVSDDKAQVVISANRMPAVRTALSHGRFTLDLLNTKLTEKASLLEKFEHPFLQAVSLVARGDGATRLILDLTRAVCYTIRPGDKGNFVLELTRPNGAVGKLAGKTVVVDAGHGGKDSGARGINGTYEKNVTLNIATELAQQLHDAGANVVMTRATDNFVEVDDRPVIANRVGADFFVSVHCDSADRSSVPNGSTIYFHMDWSSCRTLAQCIADRMGDMGGIRTNGVHSDGKQFGGRFYNGYGVLRGSQMVAVLCECGYMTNASDVRRLNDPEMQKKIAGAIAGGLRDYIEGNPNFDTRFVNPQPEGVTASADATDTATPPAPVGTPPPVPTDPDESR